MDARRTVAVLLCLLFSSSVLALDRIGPPKAGLKKGQLSLGFDYSFSREDLEASGSDVRLLYGESPQTIKDVESNRYYGNISLGLADYLEIFVRLGIADADSDELEFNGTDKLGWGYGIKGTFYEQGNLTLGAIGQMSWISTNDAGSVSVLGSQYDWKVDYDVFEIQIAIGPTVDMGGWFLYGGPFYYMLQGDIDLDISGVAKLSADLEEESAFGGFIGAHLPIGDKLSLGLDWAMTGDGYAIGTGLRFKF
jgi:hypothetical protein